MVLQVLNQSMVRGLIEALFKPSLSPLQGFYLAVNSHQTAATLIKRSMFQLKSLESRDLMN